MRAFILGGGGFLGRHICKELVDAGHTVDSFDLVHCEEKGVVNHQGSIMVEPSLGQALEIAQPDAVVHLAAVLGVANTERRRRYTIRVNVLGTFYVVEACERLGIDRLVYLSSSEVYGEPDLVPTPETVPLLGRSVYARTKQVGEEIVQSFSGAWTIARPFNVIGPGQRDDFVVPRFCRQALAGGELTVYGRGQQTRAFCHVRDLARAVWMILERPGESARQVFNVGNPDGLTTIRNLAEAVVRLAGKGLVKLQADADRSAERDILEREPDITKAVTLLGWVPEISLEDGLRELLSAPAGG